MRCRPRHLIKVFNWLVMLFVCFYLGLQFMPPFVFGFNPGEMRVLDAPYGNSPILDTKFTVRRTIKTDLTATVWRGDRGPQYGQRSCGGQTVPRTYHATSGPLVNRDLHWLIPDDKKCTTLKEGGYWLEVCWTLTDPVGDWFPFLPDNVLGIFAPRKTICRSSNLFFVRTTALEQRSG